MAFAQSGWQRVSFGGALPGTPPAGGGIKNVYNYVTNDTLSVALGAGYFDTIDGDPLTKGDLILCQYANSGTPGAILLDVTVGGATPTVKIAGLGASATDVLSFYGKTPIVKPVITKVVTATGTTTLNKTKINRLYAALKNLGIITTA